MKIKPGDFSPTQPRGFIVVDGANGAGKTTLLNSISALLDDAGARHIRTREPGPSTELGRVVRKLLLDCDDDPITPISELFLFGADRAEHVQKIILPATQDGVVVLSDRYYYSTFAFQGKGRGLDGALVNTVNEAAIAGVRPDIAIFLDLPPEIGLARTKKREKEMGESAERDAFEEEELSFHQRLREGFLELAETCPEPVLVIDATQTPEAIFSSVAPLIREILSQRA
jgi:dTMP kinase